MELKVLKDEKEKLVLQLNNENATIAAAIKNELWNDPKIKVATLTKKHPLVGKPEIIVEGSNPKGMIKEAVKRIQKNIDKLKKDFLKEI